MRRVGTLTSACTLLALGLLLFVDIVFQSSWFAGGLNYWPLIVIGLGIEVLVAWLLIRRKRTHEMIRPDGRSLALLFLVGVFSVNFYLTNIRTAEGAAEEPAPPLFPVTTYDVVLPVQTAVPRDGTRQVVIRNPYGKIEISGADDGDLKVEAVAHVPGSSDVYAAYGNAMMFTPTLEFGEVMTVGVQAESEQQAEQNGARATVDLKISVPKGIALAVQTERGDVQIEGHRGNISVWAKSGTVAVENLIGDLNVDNLGGAVRATDVLGSVTLNGQQGNLSAADIIGTLKVKVQAGNASIRNVSGTLTLTADMGEVELAGIGGDAQVKMQTGPLSIRDVQAALVAQVHTGDIKVTGAVRGTWTMNTENGKVQLTILKQSDISFLGETAKGVIKGPTKQSPSGGTKQGALLTEQMGEGTYPVTVRTDNGSIIVDQS